MYGLLKIISRGSSGGVIYCIFFLGFCSCKNIFKVFVFELFGVSVKFRYMVEVLSFMIGKSDF